MTSIALGVLLIEDQVDYNINPGEATVFLINPNLGSVTVHLPSALELPRGTVYYFKNVGGNVESGGVEILAYEGEWIDLVDVPGYILTAVNTYVKLISYGGGWYVLGGEGELILR